MKPLKKITDTIERLTSLQGNYRRVAKTSPRHFSLRDWRFALLEAKNSIGTKNIGILAAGIAYFTTLSFFPLIAAAVAISTFFITDSQLQDVVHSLDMYLPADIASLISTQLKNALGNGSTNMIVAIVAILISLFSVSGAVQNVITATNIIYERKESRNFFKLRLESLLITFSTLIVGFIAICLLALNESILRHIGTPEILVVIIPYLRWIVLAALISTSLAAFYRYGPDRKNPHWQWVSWGAVIATVVWLLGTTLFFVYAQYFANFSDTYSLFAGIIVLMTWLNLTAFIVLLGAAINHRLEARTVRRTTK
jgi:membrane protein